VLNPHSTDIGIRLKNGKAAIFFASIFKKNEKVSFHIESRVNESKKKRGGWSSVGSGD